MSELRYIDPIATVPNKFATGISGKSPLREARRHYFTLHQGFPKNFLRTPNSFQGPPKRATRSKLVLFQQ